MEVGEGYFISSQAEASACRFRQATEPEPDWNLPEMAWAKPQFARGEVDRAGEILIADEFALGNEWDHALSVINNWRSCHSYPLLALRMTLTQRAKKVDDHAVIAQRLKRLSSIAVKLRRNENMALSQMQDIGGCRAIVRSVRSLNKLIAIYEKTAHFRKKDYVKEPKSDGYRSAHFVCKYRSNLPQQKAYLGLRVEIQLRSRLQHAWATAVETVDIFSRQSIKTGGGEDGWRRFFALMSSSLAIREGTPVVPGTPTDMGELTRELRAYVKDLRVLTVLNGWSAALDYLPVKLKAEAEAFLLFLDVDANTVRVTSYTNEEGARASEEYLTVEKEIQLKPAAQAVLVSAQSVRGLRTAFPNYFADTSLFIDAVKRAVS